MLYPPGLLILSSSPRYLGSLLASERRGEYITNDAMTERASRALFMKSKYASMSPRA
ncbi:MAG: hypothetical protein JRM76_06060 [Nitrososphaerota archaeon]|nr:hypothetical protein [Nitrososphaerota archaeon]MDG6921339.1 hypothetical protein [Nitrososphaerota archaeon]MDG6992787.1 hypothetical protein [Nitrososphaerota archaeon]